MTFKCVSYTSSILKACKKEELQATTNKYNSLQQKSEEELTKINLVHELKLRSMVLQIKRSKEDHDNAVQEAETQYKDKIRSLEEELQRCEREAEEREIRELESISSLKEKETSKVLDDVKACIESIIRSHYLPHDEDKQLTVEDFGAVTYQDDSGQPPSRNAGESSIGAEYKGSEGDSNRNGR